MPFTARIGRSPFHRARSASKKGTWPLRPRPPASERVEGVPREALKRERVRFLCPDW
jgi:hypothetical protein